MRAAGAESWEPAHALMRWMLAQAADDLTPNPELQNPFRRRVSSVHGSAIRIGLREGRPQLRTSVPFGGVGGVRLLDRPGGATFDATGSTAELVWGIARVR
jgi:hypothetical protein